MPKKKVDTKMLVTIADKDQAVNQRLMKEAHWYALQCVVRYERKIVESLVKAGFDSYVPIRREQHQWSDRKKWVDVVLTPRFIFVKMKLSDRTRVFVDKNITSIVHAPGTGQRPCPIAEEQMNTFIDLTQRTSNIELVQTPLEKGDMVRVKSGRLEGYVGEFLRIDGSSKIIVRLNEALTAAVSVSRQDVEKLPGMRIVKKPEPRRKKSAVKTDKVGTAEGEEKKPA